jgi:hypothetical protein
MFHRPWGRLSPEGRWLATLLYFLLVTPRLKDYSLHLFFFPVFCTLRDAARTGTVVGKWLVVMFGVVGVTWFIAYMVLKDPGFLRFILGIISVANLVIVLAMLLRLLHAGFARPGFVATAAARNRPIAAEAEPQGVNSEG